jgi:hypothetical protein
VDGLLDHKFPVPAMHDRLYGYPWYIDKQYCHVIMATSGFLSSTPDENSLQAFTGFHCPLDHSSSRLQYSVVTEFVARLQARSSGFRPHQTLLLASTQALSRSPCSTVGPSVVWDTSSAVNIPSNGRFCDVSVIQRLWGFWILGVVSQYQKLRLAKRQNNFHRLL